MIRGAIFDLDGTLLDSMPMWDGVGKSYLRSVGREPEAGLSGIIKDLSLHRSAQYFKERYGLPQSIDVIVSGINAIVEHYYRYEARLKPGAEKLVRKLSENGIRMIVVTETDAGLARAALRRCGIEGYFSDVLSTAAGDERTKIRISAENDAAGGKHAPNIFNRALTLLGTDRDGTLVFEDALYALKTAHNAGFPTAGVFDPHEPAQSELRKYCDLYLLNFENLDYIMKFFSAPRAAEEAR